MDQIIYIFLLLNILFLIERKAINKLICYVGIVLTIALIISNLKDIKYINAEYISYILILVQLSALTILFGFIIMLYPILNNPVSQVYKNKEIFIFLLSFILILYLLTKSHSLDFNYIQDIENMAPLWKDKYVEDMPFLSNLGNMLYNDNNTIIKLIILTIILLLAIIALFFIISS